MKVTLENAALLVSIFLNALAIPTAILGFLKPDPMEAWIDMQFLLMRDYYMAQQIGGQNANIDHIYENPIYQQLIKIENKEQVLYPIHCEEKFGDCENKRSYIESLIISHAQGNFSDNLRIYYATLDLEDMLVSEISLGEVTNRIEDRIENIELLDQRKDSIVPVTVKYSHSEYTPPKPMEKRAFMLGSVFEVLDNGERVDWLYTGKLVIPYKIEYTDAVYGKLKEVNIRQRYTPSVVDSAIIERG